MSFRHDQGCLKVKGIVPDVLTLTKPSQTTIAHPRHSFDALILFAAALSDLQGEWFLESSKVSTIVWFLQVNNRLPEDQSAVQGLSRDIHRCKKGDLVRCRLSSNA